MLLAIRDFIHRQGHVNSDQISREFCIAKEALAPILEICVTKGLIRILESQKNCGSSCRSCPSQRIDYYEWVT